MSIAGLLTRFAAIYIALLGSIAIAFNRLGLNANSGVNAGALVGAVLAACHPDRDINAQMAEG